MPKHAPEVPSGRWWSRRLSSIPLWVWVVSAVVALATISRVVSGAADDQQASAGPVPGPTSAIAQIVDGATTTATPGTTTADVVTTIVTPVTTIVVTVPGAVCDPNYADVCVPVADDVDCVGSGGDGPAYVRGPVRIIGDDVYDLDGDDRDGIGCDT